MDKMRRASVLQSLPGARPSSSMHPTFMFPQQDVTYIVLPFATHRPSCIQNNNANNPQFTGLLLPHVHNIVERHVHRSYNVIDCIQINC